MTAALAVAGLVGNPITVGTPVTPPEPSTILERIDAISGGPDYHWRLADASGTTMAARVGGVNGTWVNAVELGIDPLTQEAASGKGTGFDGSSSSAAHGTIVVGGAGIAISANFSIACYVQLDQHKLDHSVFRTDPTGTGSPGQWDLKFIDDGAGGMKPWVRTRGADGTTTVYVGTNQGTVPIGSAFLVERIQSAGSLRVRINGNEIALTLDSGTQPATWPATPAGALYIGASATVTEALDGLISEIAIWNDYILTSADGMSLDIPQSVVWLRNIDAGEVEVDTTLSPIQLSSLAHPALGFEAAVTTPASLGTLTADGEILEYAAGSSDGTDTAGRVQISIGALDSPIVTFTATVTGEAGPPPPSGDLPFFGQYYGADSHSNRNGELRWQSSTTGGSMFFFADRSGAVTGLQWSWRYSWDNLYSGQEGPGIMRIRIFPANGSTRTPITTGTPLSEVSGHVPPIPGSGVGTVYINITMTSNAPLVAGNPYAIVITNTHADTANNYVSTNIVSLPQWDARDGGPHFTAPGAGGAVGGINVASGGILGNAVGASPAIIRNYAPHIIEGYPNIVGGELYPQPFYRGADGLFNCRRMGGMMGSIRYSDGQLSMWGRKSSEDTWKINLTGTGPNQVRQRWRVSRATRVVSGFYIWMYRNASGGTVRFLLESGPTTDTHDAGNGTLIEEVSVNANLWLLTPGATNDYQQANTGVDGPLDLVHHVWVPFSTNRTLTLGQIYNLRIIPNGCNIWVRGYARADEEYSPSGRTTATWDSWEANRQVSWTAWEDSRGPQVSTNNGSSWAYGPAGSRQFALTFKCE